MSLTKGCERHQCYISKVTQRTAVPLPAPPCTPPRPPSWLPSVPQGGHQLVRKAARSAVVAVSKGQLPSLTLQVDDSSQCPSVTGTGWLLFPWPQCATSSLCFPRSSPGTRAGLALHGCVQTQSGNRLSALAHAAPLEQHCPSAKAFHRKLPATLIPKKTGGSLYVQLLYIYSYQLINGKIL